MARPSKSHYHTVIIGAGMAGLAAGIRLAHYGRDVLIVEQHNVPGGLNSFYSIGRRQYDVGLHALTNYSSPGLKGAPLTKLLRQLRIRREEWKLAPQRGSRIAFSGTNLRFTNDFNVLREDIAQIFPSEIDGFDRLTQFVREYDPFNLNQKESSAKEKVIEWIHEPLLREMLFAPLMYYGSARENDMDLGQFVIMFRALYLEGLARPLDGVRIILKSLRTRFRELGGERKMRCAVKRLIPQNNRIHEIELEDGTVIQAEHILSSAGRPETLAMIEGESREEQLKQAGRLAYAETISVYDHNPADWGWEDTIIFFNRGEALDYSESRDPIDLRSGVICIPNNFEYSQGGNLEEGWLRLTALANYDFWKNAPEYEYVAQKRIWFKKMKETALSFLPTPTDPHWERREVTQDMFTPRTVEKYTRHFRGAIYGTPNKWKNGKTPWENLYLCGTDQGFLGVIGAMLSGISMANGHILQGM